MVNSVNHGGYLLVIDDGYLMRLRNKLEVYMLGGVFHQELRAKGNLEKRFGFDATWNIRIKDKYQQ